jgi:large subunit ribosomal protein L21
MYAIVKAAGRQVRVTPGGMAIVDGTAGEPGAELTLTEVLLVEKDGGEVLAGAPFVANARITAVVEGESRGPKIRVFKEEAAQGHAADQGSPRHLHPASHQRHSSVRFQRWLIRKVKGAPATAAIPTRSGWA